MGTSFGLKGFFKVANEPPRRPPSLRRCREQPREACLANAHLFFKLIYLFIFLAALGLRCCARAFSSCGEQGLLFTAVRGLFLLQSTGSMHMGFSSCGTGAQ